MPVRIAEFYFRFCHVVFCAIISFLHITVLSSWKHGFGLQHLWEGSRCRKITDSFLGESHHILCSVSPQPRSWESNPHCCLLLLPWKSFTVMPEAEDTVWYTTGSSGYRSVLHVTTSFLILLYRSLSAGNQTQDEKRTRCQPHGAAIQFWLPHTFN